MLGAGADSEQMWRGAVDDGGADKFSKFCDQGTNNYAVLYDHFGPYWWNIPYLPSKKSFQSNRVNSNDM